MSKNPEAILRSVDICDTDCSTAIYHLLKLARTESWQILWHYKMNRRDQQLTYFGATSYFLLPILPSRLYIYEAM